MKSVLVLGILAIAGIYALRTVGGIDGIKERLNFGSEPSPQPQPVPVAPTPGTPGTLAPLPAPATPSENPTVATPETAIAPTGVDPVAQVREPGPTVGEINPGLAETPGGEPISNPLPSPVPGPVPVVGEAPVTLPSGGAMAGDLDRESIDPFVAPPAESGIPTTNVGSLLRETDLPVGSLLEVLPGEEGAAKIGATPATPTPVEESAEPLPQAIVVPGGGVETAAVPGPGEAPVEVGASPAVTPVEGEGGAEASVASPIGNGSEASAAPAPEAADTGSSPPEDPGQRVAAIMEPVGSDVIRAYYQSSAIDERSRYVIDSEMNQPAMEAYYRRYQELPTLESIQFRGPMRDAASGRWFGVFDVREKENQSTHRWCVVQVRPGEMKLDWNIYQQLIDQSLDRFLSDPEAEPKAFRMVIRRGEEPPSDENPWPGKTWELHLQPPLDMAQPRTLLISESEFQRLGLDQALVGGNARIGRVELSWVPSELEPLTKVPTVTKVLGWGAW